MYVDTEIVLWVLPGVFVLIALLAKLYVHRTKPNRRIAKTDSN